MVPTFADEGSTITKDVDPWLLLPRLHRTALHRVTRLAEAIAERGLVALVDDQHAVDQASAVVRVGEMIRAPGWKPRSGIAPSESLPQWSGSGWRPGRPVRRSKPSPAGWPPS